MADDALALEQFRRQQEAEDTFAINEAGTGLKYDPNAAKNYEAKLYRQLSSPSLTSVKPTMRQLHADFATEKLEDLGLSRDRARATAEKSIGGTSAPIFGIGVAELTPYGGLLTMDDALRAWENSRTPGAAALAVGEGALGALEMIPFAALATRPLKTFFRSLAGKRDLAIKNNRLDMKSGIGPEYEDKINKNVDRFLSPAQFPSSFPTKPSREYSLLRTQEDTSRRARNGGLSSGRR